MPRPFLRSSAAAVVAVAALAVTAVIAPAAADAARPGRVVDPSTIGTLNAEVANGTLSATHGSRAVCATNGRGCRSRIVTAARGSKTPLSASAPVGWGATALEKAFSLTSAPAPKRLVVIIGVGAYPTLESDLATYRQQYGLPACTRASKCLMIHDYLGGKPLQPSDPGAEEELAVETSLDVQMVSAACPSCRIAYLGVPVDGVSNRGYIADFGIGTQTAVKLGAAAVSISYGFNTNSGIDNGPLSQRMLQPGLGLFSAVGDFGYMDPATFQTGTGGWPQNLRSVVSVGGTTMRRDAATPTGYSQTAWDGAGSGCAPDLPAAYGQPAQVAHYCNGRRAVSDIAAVADNLAVYDTYAPASGTPFGWITVGGTSASSPFMAGISARAPEVNDALGPNVIYRAPASAFTDITTGTNGTAAQCSADGVSQRLCHAAPGWDGATGRGIPVGIAPFEP